MIKMTDKNIKNPPSNDAYPIVSTLFVNKRFNKHQILINSLSLTILDLIKQGQIKCDIDWEKSHEVGKKLNESDLEVMKSITLRIANKGELKTSESMAINLLKTMNKNKKFNLKDMLKQSKNSAVANRFDSDFAEFKKALENENGYSPEDYQDIRKDGKFTEKGKELRKEWENFQKYLKSHDLTGKYPPESIEENSSSLFIQFWLSKYCEYNQNFFDNLLLIIGLDKSGKGPSFGNLLYGSSNLLFNIISNKHIACKFLFFLHS